MLARWLALLALCCALAKGSRAHAQEAKLAEVVHVEPEDDRCLSPQVVRARVQRRLARNAVVSDVQVIVRATEPPSLTVLRGGQVVAERRFEQFPARCEARRDAIAVAVALAIERARELPPSAQAAASGSAAGDATPASAASATAQTVPEAGDAAPAASAPSASGAPANERARSGDSASEAAESATFGAHAGIGAVLEVLPGPAWVGALGAEAELFSRLRVSLAALASLPQSDDVLEAAIESRLVLGRLLACTDVVQLSALALEGCGGALAGVVVASGRGFESDRSDELAYVAALARAAVRVPVQSVLSARLALDGLLPVLRPGYALQEGASDRTTVIAPAPVGAALSFEVVLALQ